MHKRSHRPVLRRRANSDDEITENVFSARRVCDFGVKLEAKETIGAPDARGCGKLAVGRRADADEARRHSVNLVPVGHPHLKRVRQARKEVAHAGLVRTRRLANVCMSELAVRRLVDAPAEHVGHLLKAVANTEDG